MPKLTQIIKEDAAKIGQVFKEAAKGVVCGVYTPALLITAGRQFNREINRIDVREAEAISKAIGQILSAGVIYVPLAKYAHNHGMGLEFFGALALTNIADYLAYVYKRSKE